MDFWSGLQLYAVIALALAGTSYWNLYRPAIELLEEILERKEPLYSGWFGSSLWILISFIGAPLTLVYLLSNNNNQRIVSIATGLAESLIQDEE